MDLSRGKLPAARHRARWTRFRASHLSHAGDDNPNAAQVRFLVDGATLADASPYSRVAYVFDGRDAEAVSRARAEWQAAKARGDAVSYWQQDADGRWQQKA